MLIFRYDEAIDEEIVSQRIRDAFGEIRSVINVPKVKKKWPALNKDHPSYRKKLSDQKKYRHENYSRLKEYKKRINGT